jgi:hypothetical protein
MKVTIWPPNAGIALYSVGLGKQAIWGNSFRYPPLVGYKPYLDHFPFHLVVENYAI